jgi:hypothetical protein
MVSLTWVYVISLSIVSGAGMFAAFVGDRIHPIKGGDLGIPPPTPAQVATATASANELARRLRDASKEDIALKTASSPLPSAPEELPSKEEASSTEQTEEPGNVLG